MADVRMINGGEGDRLMARDGQSIDMKFKLNVCPVCVSTLDRLHPIHTNYDHYHDHFHNHNKLEIPYQQLFKP